MVVTGGVWPKGCDGAAAGGGRWSWAGSVVWRGVSAKEVSGWRKVMGEEREVWVSGGSDSDSGSSDAVAVMVAVATEGVAWEVLV